MWTEIADHSHPKRHFVLGCICGTSLVVTLDIVI